MFGVALNACLTRAELDAMLRAVGSEEYRQARTLIEKIHAPAYRRRAFLRKPDKHLAGILARWRPSRRGWPASRGRQDSGRG